MAERECADPDVINAYNIVVARVPRGAWLSLYALLAWNEYHIDAESDGTTLNIIRALGTAITVAVQHLQATNQQVSGIGYMLALEAENLLLTLAVGEDIPEPRNAETFLAEHSAPDDECVRAIASFVGQYIMGYPDGDESVFEDMVVVHGPLRTAIQGLVRA